jgi:hypothetical protein
MPRKTGGIAVESLWVSVAFLKKEKMGMGPFSQIFLNCPGTCVVFLCSFRSQC